MPFTLHIFESEFKEIENFVLQYQNIETGGDLFGLWTRDAEPVVQLIIGPGRKCRRTSVSFHQDTDYLQNVGTFVNTSFMLCHIGSWHSHHQLSLTHPSAGDRSTVCNNFPRGLQRYIMIIANIECSTRTGAKYVVIHPYMFTSEGRACEKGTVEKTSGTSPFREDGNVLRTLCQGAEQNRASSYLEYDKSTRATSPRNVRRSPSKTESPRSFKTSRKTHSSTTQQRNTYQVNRDVKQWYTTPEGENKLKKLHEQIRRILKPSTKVEFLRNPYPYDLSLEFQHDGNKWKVEFPKSFDQKPARIYCNSICSSISSTNIVEAIQGACPCSSCSATSVNRYITSQLHRSSSRLDNHDVGKLKNCGDSSGRKQHVSNGRLPDKFNTTEVPWCKTADGKLTLERLRNQICSFLSMNGERDEVKVIESSDIQDVSLSFCHGNSVWFIKFNGSCPSTEVELLKKQRGTKQSICTLSSPLDVIETLKRSCRCQKCAPLNHRPSSRKYTPAHSRYFVRDTILNPGEARINLPDVLPRTITRSPIPHPAATRRYQEQWYSNDRGEKRLREICTQLSALFLNGKEVDISRSTETGNILVKFDHNHRDWRIEFPTHYPKSPPEIGYYDHLARYRPSSPIPINGNIVDQIRAICCCRECRLYRSGRR